MISPASCVVGVYYVPTPRDGGYLPPEEGITDGYPRPLHTHRDTLEGELNVQIDVETSP